MRPPRHQIQHLHPSTCQPMVQVLTQDFSWLFLHQVGVNISILNFHLHVSKKLITVLNIVWQVLHEQ